MTNFSKDTHRHIHIWNFCELFKKYHDSLYFYHEQKYLPIFLISKIEIMVHLLILLSSRVPYNVNIRQSRKNTIDFKLEKFEATILVMQSKQLWNLEQSSNMCSLNFYI